MHFLVPRVLQKKQPHRHQEVLQHPLHPQLNVEVSYNDKARVTKMVVFFEGRRVHPLCPTLNWGQGGANSSI